MEIDKCYTPFKLCNLFSFLWATVLRFNAVKYLITASIINPLFMSPIIQIPPYIFRLDTFCSNKYEVMNAIFFIHVHHLFLVTRWYWSFYVKKLQVLFISLQAFKRIMSFKSKIRYITFIFDHFESQSKDPLFNMEKPNLNKAAFYIYKYRHHFHNQHKPS